MEVLQLENLDDSSNAGKKVEDTEKRNRGKSISAAVLLGLARRKIETLKIKQLDTANSEDNKQITEEIKENSNASPVINEINIAKTIPAKRRYSTLETPSENDNEIFAKPFEQGWTRELVYRASGDLLGKRQADVYYKSPDNIKLRSYPNITDYLLRTKSTLSIEHFSFSKRAIYHYPEETVRHAESRHASIASSVKSTPSSSPKTPKIVTNFKKNLSKSADKAQPANRIDTTKLIARQLVKTTEARRRQHELDLEQDVNEILQHTKPQLEESAERMTAKAVRQYNKRKLSESNENIRTGLISGGTMEKRPEKNYKPTSPTKSPSPNKPIISIIIEKAARRREKREEKNLPANNSSNSKVADSSLKKLALFIQQKTDDKTILNNDASRLNMMLNKEIVRRKSLEGSIKTKSKQADENIKVIEVISLDDDEEPLAKKTKPVSTLELDKRKAARTATNLALRAYMDNALKSVEKKQIPSQSMDTTSPSNQAKKKKVPTATLR